MRAGPLSDAKVVKLLNESFIPVHLLIKDYDVGGKAPQSEKDEFKNVCGDISDAKKGVAFIVNPNGKIIETLVSSPAITTERVISVLQSAASTIGTEPGRAVGEPMPQAPPPTAEAGGLVLRLAARYLPKTGKGWAQMPAEDWIELSADECRKFIGDVKGTAGEEWTIDAGVSKKILNHFYPPSLNFDVDKGRLDKAELKAKVKSVSDGIALIRIDGSMKMKRPFTFAKDDDLFVVSDIVGYAHYDLKAKRLRKMELVSEQGTYAKASFGIAVRSLD